MRTIAIINQKGGCGKTTTAINLAAAFAEQGKRTLLVDVDPQSHCALGLSIPEARIHLSVSEAFLPPPGGFRFADALWQINPKLDLLPSTTRLAAVEHRLATVQDRDLRLAKALGPMRSHYEICIIDCPPSIGLLTFNALRAAKEIIIPVETGYFSLNGAVKQAATLQVLADRVQHDVVFHVLPTMYDDQTPMADQIIAELKKQFGDRVLHFAIGYQIQLKEAAGMGVPILEHAPDSRSAHDYARLAQHLLDHAPTSGRIAESSAAAAMVEQATRVAGSPEPIVAAPSMSSITGGEASRELPPPDAVRMPGAERLADLLQRAKALSDRSAARRGIEADLAEANDESNLPSPKPRRDPAAIAQRMSRLYGVRLTQQGVLFVQPDSEVHATIHVTGDFNGWSTTATPLRRDRSLGVWQACLNLEPGRYRYQLVIDGQISPDPHNAARETADDGRSLNVVEVQ